MEKKTAPMDKPSIDPLYSILIKQHGYVSDALWHGVMNDGKTIYVVRIADNDFDKGDMGQFTDATNSIKQLVKEIKGSGKTVIQFKDVFFDVGAIQGFLADAAISKEGKFYIANSKLPIAYQFDGYYAFFLPYDIDKLDDAVSNGEYFTQYRAVGKPQGLKARCENQVKVFTEINPESSIHTRKESPIAEKFTALATLKGWKEYLINTFPTLFKDDWITKSISYLLIEYCDRDILSARMPTLTLNKFIERMSVDDPTKITLKLFEIITELKDSKFVSRSGKKETSKTLLTAELNYLNLLESKISLSPWALKTVLEMPSEVVSVAEEFAGAQHSKFSENEEELKRLYMPTPPVGRIIEPTFDFDDCILSPSVRSEVEGFINSVERREKLLLWGVDYTPKLLLAGVIGTGKTITAHAIAKRLGMHLFRVSGEDIVASYLGETAKNVLQAFDYATSNRSRVIFFIDELDSVVSKRGFDSSVGKELGRAVNTFITLMEERNEIMIGATNHAHEIDASCLSRFTKLIFFELPDQEMMVQLLKIHVKKIPLASGVSLSSIAPDLVEHHFSGRDVRNLAVEIVQEMLSINAEFLTKEILARCMARTIGRGEQFLAASKKYKDVLKNG
jgi:hypothetical protein